MESISELIDLVHEPNTKYNSFIYKSIWFRNEISYFKNILDLISISSNLMNTDGNLPIIWLILSLLNPYKLKVLKLKDKAISSAPNECVYCVVYLKKRI